MKQLRLIAPLDELYGKGRINDIADHHQAKDDQAWKAKKYSKSAYHAAQVNRADRIQMQIDWRKERKHAQKEEDLAAQRAKNSRLDARKARAGMKEETLNEKLSKNASSSEYVDDFVHSSNSKFSKDSKKQRIKRALGAYYAQQHEKHTEHHGHTGDEYMDDNVEFDGNQIDELSRKTLGSYVKKSLQDVEQREHALGKRLSKAKGTIVDKRRKGINKAIDRLSGSMQRGRKTAGGYEVWKKDYHAEETKYPKKYLRNIVKDEE